LSITGVDFVIETGVDAPSVHVPESFFPRRAAQPLAGNPLRWAYVACKQPANAPLSRCSCCAVLLPESFRGGCSVGVAVNLDDLSRAALQNGTTIPSKKFRRKCFVRCTA
jgi:hypothetical protein